MSTTFMSAQFIMLSSKQMVPYTQREVKVTCRAWRSVNKNLFAVPLSMPLPPRGGASFSENQQTIKIALTHCWDRVGESREAIPKQWRRSEGGSFWKCLNGTRSRELNCHRSPTGCGFSSWNAANVTELKYSPLQRDSQSHSTSITGGLLCAEWHHVLWVKIERRFCCQGACNTTFMQSHSTRHQTKCQEPAREPGKSCLPFPEEKAVHLR